MDEPRDYITILSEVHQKKKGKYMILFICAYVDQNKLHTVYKSQDVEAT